MDRITSIRPAPPRFVLVAVNSDDPVEARDRQRVAEFAPIVAFYATNLKRGAADDKCFPIPLGMPWHQWRYPNEPWANGSIGQPLKIDSTALNEDDRVGNLAEQRHIFDLRQKLVDGRIKKKAKVFWCVAQRGLPLNAVMGGLQSICVVLRWGESPIFGGWTFVRCLGIVGVDGGVKLLRCRLLTSARCCCFGRCGTFTSEVRKVYVEALQKADLLELCTGHISLGQWHDVLAQYAFVLSPRGIGYDCFRHWQVLSAGSIPIIPIEEDFDLRVFNGTTAWLVRSPEEVVEGFRARLPAAMKPPLTADLPDTLSLKAWNRRFRSHIKT